MRKRHDRGRPSGARHRCRPLGGPRVLDRLSPQLGETRAQGRPARDFRRPRQSISTMLSGRRDCFAYGYATDGWRSCKPHPPSNARSRKQSGIRHLHRWSCSGARNLGTFASARMCRQGTNGTNLLRILEAPPGFEPGMEVLQTSALPLGDGAVRTTIRREFQAIPKFR